MKDRYDDVTEKINRFPKTFDRAIMTKVATLEALQYAKALPAEFSGVRTSLRMALTQLNAKMDKE